MPGRKMVALPQELWQEVETYHQNHRYSSQAAALRSLIESGLTTGQYRSLLEHALSLLNLERVKATLSENERLTLDGVVNHYIDLEMRRGWGVEGEELRKQGFDTDSMSNARDYLRYLNFKIGRKPRP